MDITPFKELFDSLSQISQLNFEVWDDDVSVFSSRPNGTSISVSRQIKNFSTQVMSQAAFQQGCFNGHQDIFGVPIRNEEQVIGTLLAYRTNSEKKPEPKAIDSREMPNAKEMKTLLTVLSGLMEDKRIAQKEQDEMAEELSQSFEDLYLYSRIATNIKTLRLSSSMQKNLAEEILKTMQVDLAFIMMPERQESNVYICNPEQSVKIRDQESFINGLLNAIPPDAPSMADNYFIVKDSSTNPEYSKLHVHPFRFLVVRIHHEGSFFGWLGIISFNLKGVLRRSELRLLISVANQLAMVISNTDLFHDLEHDAISMIKSLVYALEAKDVYTRGHSERVRNLCTLMANRLELGMEEKSVLQWASILHDVGKIGVPEKILNKDGLLDDEEYEIIKGHPAKGHAILLPLERLSGSLPGILHHHECYDGRGYPKGLKGEEIPLYARIIAIVDTFDAITSKRAYRSARTPQNALAIIEEAAGTQFDPYLVSVFKEVFSVDLEIEKEGKPCRVGYQDDASNN